MGRKSNRIDEVAMARLIALLFAAGAGFRLWRDWGASVDVGEKFSMTTLGEIWSSMSPNSLASVQNVASGLMSTDMQAKLLAVPFVAVLLVLAALFWFLGRGPAPKRKQFGR